MQAIATAIRRAQAVLRRRPVAGLHADAPAVARWQGGLRIVSRHANGTQMTTDMPGELGGSGDRVTPGWLFRAGLASCAATRIAMAAASTGIELAMLEVQASSRSDTRGLLGMTDAEGAPVSAGPRDLQLRVRISAPDVAPERLRALVEDGCRCSPVHIAVQNALSVTLRVDVESR